MEDVTDYEETMGVLRAYLETAINQGDGSCLWWGKKLHHQVSQARREKGQALSVTESS